MVSTTPSSSLASRYESLGVQLDAPGDWPVLIEPWAPAGLAGTGRVIEAPPALDRGLRAEGEHWLTQALANGLVAYNGGVLALDTLRPGFVTMRPAGFYQSLYSHALLAEEWKADGPTPLRDRIEARCDGDPLRKGWGRVTALGVSCLLVFDGARGPEFLLGRRQNTLPQAPGRWSVVPSGTVEPMLTGALAHTVETEAREELLMDGFDLERMVAGVTVLGAAYDLLCLHAEICCLLICAGERPQIDQGEHSEAIWRPFDDDGLKGALTDLGPQGLVPVSAGALELARWRLETLG